MRIDLSSPDKGSPPQALVVDDDPDVRQAARLLLCRHGYGVREAADAAETRARLADARADVVLLDLNLRRGETSGEEGLALLAELLVQDRQAAVVVVTAHSGVNIAVKAMRAGAVDFVTKPWSNARLLATLDAAVAGRRPAGGGGEPGEEPVLLGESPSMVQARELIRRTAPSEASVLICGPQGSGKSLMAQLLHRGSPRAPGPFIAVDVSALDADQAEAALFGDPRRDRPGALAEAKGGVLVLDEIGALAPPVQARLLVALQARAISPAAGGASVPVDVRPISLTRRPVQALQGFNHDLLNRLSAVELIAPGLAGGREDIAVLAGYFLRLFARRHGRPERTLSPAAADALAATGWPDAVRGLRRALERAVVLAAGAAIEPEDVAPPDQSAPALALPPRLADSEKALLTAALKRHGFNVSRAAADLGLTRPALYRRMAKHGL